MASGDHSIDIYGMQLSAPVRIVQMTAECLGIKYNFKVVDLLKGEHMTPEFLKLNPMHNIPTVVDGDLNMNESRAVACYLVNKYAKDDTLYPKDAVARLRVDQMLYFDMGVFYKSCGDIWYHKLGFGPEPEKKHWDKLTEVLGWVDGFVAGGKMVAGTEQMTLADLAMMATYATLKECELTDLSKYTNIEAWFAKCQKLVPNYEKANGEGATAFGNWVKGSK